MDGWIFICKSCCCDCYFTINFSLFFYFGYVLNMSEYMNACKYSLILNIWNKKMALGTHWISHGPTQINTCDSQVVTIMKTYPHHWLGFLILLWVKTLGFTFWTLAKFLYFLRNSGNRPCVSNWQWVIGHSIVHYSQDLQSFVFWGDQLNDVLNFYCW